MFGTSEQANKLFEEMIEIMPDVEKQEQLRHVYQKYKRLVRFFMFFFFLFE